MIRIYDSPFDPAGEIKSFESRTSGAGAFVTFTGKVRYKARGEKVTGLHLEHFPGVTEKSIESLVNEARNRWKVEDLLVLHRVGRLNPGEPIVLVAIAAAHRRDAFEATDFLMDGLKTQAVFWKKEIRENGEEWIEPRAQDHRDAARWRR